MTTTSPRYWLDESGARVELGRQVIVADLVATHRTGKRCTCRGSAELGMFKRDASGEMKRVLRVCQRAVEEFRKANGHLIVNTEDGPRWKAGREPSGATATP